MKASTVLFIFLLLLFVGGALLQVFLSRRKNRWLGLILPAVTLLYSFVIPFGMVTESVTLQFVLSVVLLWLAANLPTGILLAIYFACRRHYEKKEQRQRMNIQDLG